MHTRHATPSFSFLLSPFMSNDTTLIERFQAERALVLQALDEKYRDEDEAHPEHWVMHTAFNRGSKLDHDATLVRIVSQGERPVLLVLLTTLIEQGSRCFSPGATCVTQSDPSWWRMHPHGQLALADEVLAHARQADDLALRALVQSYVDEFRKDLMSSLIELIAQPIYAQWAASAIAASPSLAQFTTQLSDPETYASLLTGQDNNEGQPLLFLLASPLAEVKTVLSPQDYDDYHTHVFSGITGRCFWVTLDRATFVPLLTACGGMN
jgi:hypothetical protein